MKRATICLVCSQKVGQGFALINHKRLCKSRVNVNPPAQQEVINQQLQELPDPLESHAHGDDPEEQHQDQDIVPQDPDIDPQDPDINPIAQLTTSTANAKEKTVPQVEPRSQGSHGISCNV